MRKNSKTLTDFNVPIEAIQEEFYQICKPGTQYSDLCYIFNIALNDTTRFPQINSVTNYKEYIHRWVKGYYDAMNNLPSQRIAKPKSSCSDPAITAIVQYATQVSSEDAELQSHYHNLFMSAENIQGNLLEEYIAYCVREYGWLWCNGNVLRAIDFCTTNGSALLQIKNKSNTENSSSSAIREGTDIIKWYRLGTKIQNGTPYPSLKWEALNQIINTYAVNHSPNCNMNEDSYKTFIQKVTSANPNIVTGR